MRSAFRLCIFSYLAANTLACSEVECAPDEVKIADSCYRRKDAGAAGDGSAALSGDAPFDAALGPTLDAAKDAGEPRGPDASSQADAGSSAVDAADIPPNSAPAVDEDAAMAPGPTCVALPESCDARDNDCDGVVDNGVKTRCWADEDGDGFSAVGAALSEVCGECGAGRTAVEPTSATNTDCDDADKTRSPTVTDICGDRIDNDCDGTPDDDSNNACGGPCTAQLPGRPGEACTNGLRGACARSGTYECQSDGGMKCSAGPVAAGTEACDGVDNDCDGEVDEGVKNACGGCTPLAHAPESACSAGAGACAAAGVYKCQGADAVACNATPAAAPTWYPDCDGDGFGVPAGSVASCTAPSPPAGCMGYTRTVPAAGTTDCRDNNPGYKPGQIFRMMTPELAADPDVNCDGMFEVGPEILVGTAASSIPLPFCPPNPSSGHPNEACPTVCVKLDEGTQLSCKQRVPISSITVLRPNMNFPNCDHNLGPTSDGTLFCR